MQRAGVGVFRVDGERRAQQRIGAGLSVVFAPARGAEQRARIVRVDVEHFVEGLLRVVEVVLAEKQLAELVFGVGVRGIDGRRPIEGAQGVLEQLGIIGAEILDRGRDVDELVAGEVGARVRVVYVDEPVEFLGRAVAVAALVMQHREVERGGEAIAGVLGFCADEGAFGRGAPASQQQNLAERVRRRAAVLRRRGAARGVFRVVVMAGRGIRAGELALHAKPLAVRRRDLEKELDRVLVLAGAQRIARVVDILRGDATRRRREARARERDADRCETRAGHDLRPSMSRIDFEVRASFTSSVSSASSYASAAIAAFFVRNESI